MDRFCLDFVEFLLVIRVTVNEFIFTDSNFRDFDKWDLSKGINFGGIKIISVVYIRQYIYLRVLIFMLLSWMQK